VKNGLEDLIGETAATAVAFVVAGASLGPFILLLTKIPFLGARVLLLLTNLLAFLPGASGIVTLSGWVILRAFAAIGAGIALIFWGMTNDVKGAFGAILSAAAIFGGLFLVWYGLFALGVTVRTMAMVWPLLLLIGTILLLLKYHKKVGNVLGDMGKAIGLGFLAPAGPGLTPMASGGPVSRGRPYLVGEEGPELFSPEDDGDITSNDKLGSGGGTVNHINIKLDVSGVTDRSDKRALAREISDMLNQEVRRLGGQPTRGRF